MLKNTKDIIFNIFSPIIPMGAIRYSCPRLVPTYILPAKDISDLYTTCKRSDPAGSDLNTTCKI